MSRLLSASLVLVSCLLGSRQSLAREESLNPRIQNLSQLKCPPQDAPAGGDDVVGATSCRGSVDSGIAELQAIGVTKEALAAGVQCTVGDFDGNGYLDFAIWGIDKQDPKKSPDYQHYVVLFFDKAQVIRVVPITSKFPGRLLVHYPPRAKVGPHGEPLSKNDAMWLIGETDGYDDERKGIVYIFDQKSGKFTQTEFGKK